MDLSLVIRATTTLERRQLERAEARMGEDEFRAFYERTSRPLWAYLARLTGDGHRADDLLQEAYYRFYRAGARHESETHRRHSLFQIATNVARDEARRGRRGHEVALPEPQAGDAPRSEAAPPDQRAAARVDLARALRELPHSQRAMLWLAYAQGATHGEIAAVVGVRSTSVRTMLLRARRKLAELLSSAPGSEGAENGGGSDA